MPEAEPENSPESTRVQLFGAPSKIPLEQKASPKRPQEFKTTEVDPRPGPYQGMAGGQVLQSTPWFMEPLAQSVDSFLGPRACRLGFRYVFGWHADMACRRYDFSSDRVCALSFPVLPSSGGFLERASIISDLASFGCRLVSVVGF